MKRFLLPIALTALTLTAACSIDPARVQAALSGDRVVGDLLLELERSDAASDALILWNSFAPEDKTIELEDDLVAAVKTTIGIVGAVSPITATVFVSPVDNACAGLVGLSQAVKDAAGCQ